MIVLTVAMAAGLAAEARAEDLNPKQFAQRTELYSIPSLTISDEQFLKGDANGKPVTVNGEFRIAQGAGRLPVVVLVHGSGGYGANVELWVRELNPMGISTFVVDGFTGRGLTQVNTNQALLGRLNLILDVYRALDILAKHPRVDPQRVALMGFSRGGQATLFASLKRFNALWNKSGVELAAHLPFYPDCMTSYIDDAKLTPHPVLIFGGTPDDYNPIARCKTYAERLKAAGNDVRVIEYASAPHAFDNPLLAVPAAALTGAQSVRNCQIREESPGELVNQATHRRFQYTDACVQLDPHVGYDAQATAAARKEVAQFLATTFKLGTVASAAPVK
ncbi:MAG TPA: dienelactone hydrolase family protein [Myxococcales bacterium]|nr:dienelactone hydrolase family protein [Myxococcales bacterium]